MSVQWCCIGKPPVCRSCRSFISNFLTRLNFLSLAKIAVAVAGSLQHPADAVTFLENEVRAACPYRRPCGSPPDFSMSAVATCALLAARLQRCMRQNPDCAIDGMLT